MPILPENRARYPKDWKLRSRFVRFYRARNHCEWCGCENGQPHPITDSNRIARHRRTISTPTFPFDGAISAADQGERERPGLA